MYIYIINLVINVHVYDTLILIKYYKKLNLKYIITYTRLLYKLL